MTTFQFRNPNNAHDLRNAVDTRNNILGTAPGVVAQATSSANIARINAGIPSNFTVVYATSTHSGSVSYQGAVFSASNVVSDTR